MEKAVAVMLKQAVARLKQCPDTLNLLLQGRVSLVGVSPVYQQVIVEVMSGERMDSASGEGFWNV
jgi:hypothetical protein